MTWTLPGAILFLLALFLLLGYFLSRKIFPPSQETESSPEGQARLGPDCQSCGVEGCGGFAKALIRGGEDDPQTSFEASGQCSLTETAHQKMEQKAFIRCCGRQVAIRYHYSGQPTCQASAAMAIRPKECADACLGLGDCLSSCPIRAIQIKDGIAHIDATRCNGCGECFKACPLGLIDRIPLPGGLGITCLGPQGPAPDWQCPDGCTCCHQCVEACPEEALLKTENGPPQWLPDKCTACGVCVPACPQGIIILAQ